MKTEYIVTDECGNRSVTADGIVESFSTFGRAQKRAEELASEFPDEAISIYELVAETIAPTSSPETVRKYPDKRR